MELAIYIRKSQVEYSTCTAYAVLGVSVMEVSRVRVVVADDHPVIRMGIESALGEVPTLTHIGSAQNSTELVALLDQQPCQVLITDYAMPGGDYGDGLELVDFLRQRYPSLAIVVMTGIEMPSLIRMLMAKGIHAIVGKTDSLAHVPMAVQAAYVGRKYLSPSIAALAEADKANQVSASSIAKLSPREREVLALFVGGATISEIAASLERSKQTVSTQKIRAMAKLGVSNDAELFRYAEEFGGTPGASR